MILVGATGVGKSFLACALAHQACRKGYRAGYRRASRLFHELALARADGTYVRLLAKLARLDVLVIDDWGLAPVQDPKAVTFPRRVAMYLAHHLRPRLLTEVECGFSSKDHRIRRIPSSSRPRRDRVGRFGNASARHGDAHARRHPS